MGCREHMPDIWDLADQFPVEMQKLLDATRATAADKSGGMIQNTDASLLGGPRLLIQTRVSFHKRPAARLSWVSGDCSASPRFFNK